jgi:AcrR family transcriptional regulator
MIIHSVATGTDKRSAVLDAALALFEEHTYEGTAVPQVAVRAGVGVGTVYRYFPSKDVLVNELFRFWKTEMATYLTGVEAAPDGRTGFDRCWQGLTDFALAQPVAFRFLETHHHQPYLDDASRAVATAIDEAILRFVRRAQRAGEIRSGVPEQLIALVFGAFVGLVRAAGQGRLALDRRRLLAAGELVWNVLAPQLPTGDHR